MWKVFTKNKNYYSVRYSASIAFNIWQVRNLNPNLFIAKMSELVSLLFVYAKTQMACYENLQLFTIGRPIILFNKTFKDVVWTSEVVFMLSTEFL